MESGQCYITPTFQQRMSLVQCSLTAFTITIQAGQKSDNGVRVALGRVIRARIWLRMVNNINTSPLVIG